MADNVNITEGLGKVIAADDVGGAMYQRVKIATGVDGVARDVTTSDPLPVTNVTIAPNAATETTLSAVNTVLGLKTDAKSIATDTTSVSAMSVWKQISASVQAIVTALAGTLTVASHAVTNAGTFAVQAAQSGTWTVQPGNTANTTAWKVDGSAVTQPVSIAAEFASTASITSLASAATSAQFLASNAARKGLSLVNTDANAALVKFGTTASATSYTVRMVQNAYYELPKPIYTGRIDVIWEADGAGSLIGTEM